jgi:hypothetical protein
MFTEYTLLPTKRNSGACGSRSGQKGFTLYKKMANLSIKPTYVAGIAITVLGGLAGALLYALVYPAFSGLLGVANYGEITFATALGVNGLWIAIPFNAILFILMFKVLKDRYD